MRYSIVIIFLCSLTFDVYAQKDSITNLVFEGAGIRGIAYCGAIDALEKTGTLRNVKRVGGTSAGAITALAISLGYSASDLRTLIEQTPFNKLNDGRYFFPGGINRLNKYFGWYRGVKFQRWIEKMIQEKTGNPDMTFYHLHQKGFKQLYITGTSVDEQRLIVFSHESYPHMRVKDAVRISVSIPFYFEAVFMDDAGNIFFHPENKKGLHVMTDGGLIANFPIRLFDSTKYIDNSIENRSMVNPRTLGLRIDSDQQISNDSLGKGLASMPVTTFREYLAAMYNLIIENLNRPGLTSEDWGRTISISDGNIGPRIRNLSPSEKQKMINNGYEAIIKWLR